MSKKRFDRFAKGWAGKHMPTREDMANSKYLAPIAHRFLSPELWRFTRRSVPRGVALGLFAGFIIPLGQIFLAAFLALPARANVPLAAAVTFVTNPFTAPFWIYAANKLGRGIFKVDQVTSGGAARAELDSSTWLNFGWFLETAGVTAVGFVIMAIVASAFGYVVSGFIWRQMVARKRMRRLRARKARADLSNGTVAASAEPVSEGGVSS